jgi:hypothetical protein
MPVHARSATRLARELILAASLAGVVLAPVFAAAAVIENPATPPGGQRTVQPGELWRAGGEDAEVFFGSVGRVLAGPDGTVLVLDTQLSEVQVYDRHGTWLRTLGREGEGPGEVRGPADCWHLPDGRLCIGQSFPGRLVYLEADGTPAGSAEYRPATAPATFSVMVAGRPAPGGMLLAGIRMLQSGGPQAEQTFFLAQCDVEGREQAVFLEKDYAIDFADFRLDEAAMDFVWNGRMATDAQGNVYSAPHRDRYLVRVQAPDGEVVREFSRPVTIGERTARQRTVATKLLEGIGASYGVPLQGVTIEDREPAITGLDVRPDGTVWVRTPANEPPAGAYAVYDVFAADGRFREQVALQIAGDPDRDRAYLLADGRLAVVRGDLDAWLGQQGVASDAPDAPVLEVVVYDAF